MTDESQPRRSLDKIVVDNEIQQRVIHIDDAIVQEYAERIEAGDTFPPITVFEHEGKLILADGFHRHAAYERAGRRQIPVEIREGDRRAAILYAIESNLLHGLRPTRQDKRKAVMTLLSDKKWSAWVDRKIAKRCGVSPTTVGTIRRELEKSSVQTGQTAIENTSVIEDIAPGTVKLSKDENADENKTTAITPDKPKTTRTFERGGKQHTMNTANISKAANPRRKPTEWMKRVKESCVEVKRHVDSCAINHREAYEIGTRYASLLEKILPVMRENERDEVIASLSRVKADGGDKTTAEDYRAASGN